MGSPFKVGFSYRGNPQPSISWKHNGQLIENDDSVLKVSSGKKGYAEIYIDSVDYNHKGHYQAVAENSHGKDIVEFNIDVVGK